ncbi:MAG TPA: glycosyltransferase [Bacteroidia bacterium]|jgi:GT2 family glycosyltransferase|nr:glycosyltransferase [Bacteroidia bacterium]
MQLSVIIVNYNVQHFLEQCLHSVMKALRNVEGEVIVVDNNSVDGSVQMVKTKFPGIRLIVNKQNTGFSHANNQAILESTGTYVLLLNPDTVVEEDTFEKVIGFMNTHPEAGGLGVQMLDGKGNFLPESKRGLPTPLVAFFKIFGLAQLFPRSRLFGRYHLGYLDKNQTNEIEILSGAFMLMRKAALDKVGLLDEDFFMYGEDIDLSYRILKGGYKNYYYPETRIIHYKGESTKKSSVNYVFVFYRAMIIFARKHFSLQNAKLFSFLIHFAIYLRAGTALLSRFLKRMLLPLSDALLITAGLFLIKDYYERYILSSAYEYYSARLIAVAFPAYALIWLCTVFLSGGYDKPVRIWKIMRGVLVGTAFILIIYALLPEQFRFSRALILLGAAWALCAMLMLRFLINAVMYKEFSVYRRGSRRIVIVGEPDECNRVNALLRQTAVYTDFVGFVGTNGHTDILQNYIGRFEQLKEILFIYKIDEVIFCARDLSSQKIINQMLELGQGETDFKIAPPESLSIIGSNSIETAGDLYVIDINSITKSVNRRKKRMLDLILSLAFLLSFPITLLFQKNPAGFLFNIFRVFSGKKSWVGYSLGRDKASENLPLIRNGILNPASMFKNRNPDPETLGRLNMVYAKDYRIGNDLQIIWKCFRCLGNREEKKA